MITAVQIMCLAFAGFYMLDALAGREERRRILSFSGAVALLIIVIFSTTRA